MLTSGKPAIFANDLLKLCVLRAIQRLRSQGSYSPTYRVHLGSDSCCCQTGI